MTKKGKSQQTMPDTDVILKENWLTLSLDKLKEKTGLTVGEMYYRAYSQLGLGKRASHTSRILQPNYTLKTGKDVHLRIPGVAIKALGYELHESVEMAVKIEVNQGTFTILRKAKSD